MVAMSSSSLRCTRQSCVNTTRPLAPCSRGMGAPSLLKWRLSRRVPGVATLPVVGGVSRLFILDARRLVEHQRDGVVMAGLAVQGDGLVGDAVHRLFHPAPSTRPAALIARLPGVNTAPSAPRLLDVRLRRFARSVCGINVLMAAPWRCPAPGCAPWASSERYAWPCAGAHRQPAAGRGNPGLACTGRDLASRLRRWVWVGRSPVVDHVATRQDVAHVLGARRRVRALM